jgi:predicted PhzF superfamily epimerase YddE/YHI9
MASRLPFYFVDGRPSRIAVSVSEQRVRIGGSGLVVAEGTLIA